MGIFQNIFNAISDMIAEERFEKLQAELVQAINRQDLYGMSKALEKGADPNEGLRPTGFSTEVTPIIHHVLSSDVLNENIAAEMVRLMQHFGGDLNVTDPFWGVDGYMVARPFMRGTFWPERFAADNELYAPAIRPKDIQPFNWLIQDEPLFDFRALDAKPDQTPRLKFKMPEPEPCTIIQFPVKPKPPQVS